MTSLHNPYKTRSRGAEAPRKPAEYATQTLSVNENLGKIPPKCTTNGFTYQVQNHNRLLGLQFPLTAAIGCEVAVTHLISPENLDPARMNWYSSVLTLILLGISNLRVSLFSYADKVRVFAVLG